MNFSLSPCEKMRKQAIASLSGEISLIEKQWMDAHLSKCQDCRHSLSEMNQMMETTRGQRFLPSSNAKDRVFSSLSERIELEAPPHFKRLPEKRPVWPFYRSWGFGLTVTAAAGIAAVSLFLWMHARPDSKSLKAVAEDLTNSSDIEKFRPEESLPSPLETKRIAELLFVASPRGEEAKYRVEKLGGRITFTVDEGTLWFSFTPSVESEHLQIQGKDITVWVSGTVFMVRARPNIPMEVGVLWGRVDVIPRNGTAEEFRATEMRAADGARVSMDPADVEQGTRWSSGLAEGETLQPPEESPSAIKVVGDADKSPGLKGASREDLFADAERQMSKGKYGEAAGLLEKLVARDGASERADTARLDLARLYIDKLHRPRRAVFHLNAYLKRRPNDASAPLLRKKMCDLSIAEELPLPEDCAVP